MFMSDTNTINKISGRWAFNPPRVFPDARTCRVRRNKLDESVDCLNPWSWRCPHALQVEGGYSCRHPKKDELLASTEPVSVKPSR